MAFPNNLIVFVGYVNQGGTSFVDLLCFFCIVFAMSLYVSVYMWF